MQAVALHARHAQTDAQAKSQIVLDSIALARNLKRDAKGQRAQTPEERHHNYDPFLVYNRGKPAYLELLRLAESGERALF